VCKVTRFFPVDADSCRLWDDERRGSSYSSWPGEDMAGAGSSSDSEEEDEGRVDDYPAARSRDKRGCSGRTSCCHAIPSFLVISGNVRGFDRSLVRGRSIHCARDTRRDRSWSAATFIPGNNHGTTHHNHQRPRHPALHHPRLPTQKLPCPGLPDRTIPFPPLCRGRPDSGNRQGERWLGSATTVHCVWPRREPRVQRGTPLP
jgi:hypothetical protein